MPLPSYDEIIDVNGFLPIKMKLIKELQELSYILIGLFLSSDAQEFV